jgi:hypothetical protein
MRYIKTYETQQMIMNKETIRLMRKIINRVKKRKWLLEEDGKNYWIYNKDNEEIYYFHYYSEADRDYSQGPGSSYSIGWYLDDEYVYDEYAEEIKMLCNSEKYNL